MDPDPFPKVNLMLGCSPIHMVLGDLDVESPLTVTWKS